MQSLFNAAVRCGSALAPGACSLGPQILSLSGSLHPLRACKAAQSLASVADVSTPAWRRADAPTSEEASNRGCSPRGSSSLDGLLLAPHHMPGMGLVPGYCPFPGAAMTRLWHKYSTRTARLRPNGWEQLPGRPLPGRGPTEHRGRGSPRRPPGRSSFQHQLDQLRSEFAGYRAEAAAEQQKIRAEAAAKLQQYRAEAAAEQQNIRAEAAAKLQQYRAEAEAEQQNYRAKVAAKEQAFRAEVAPLQWQFARNVVHQVAKFVLTETRPRKRPRNSMYVDHAPRDQLKALAGVVKMSVDELEEGLKAMALLRNAGEHPGDLAALQQMVRDALQVCGEQPTDPELAFAQRLLVRYPDIEKEFLLEDDPA